MTADKKHLPIATDADLKLELIDLQHAQPLLELVSRNKDHLRQWLPWVNYMRTVADFEEYIYGCKKNHAAGTEYGYVILHHNAMIGRIGIHYIQKQSRSGAVGYWIGKDHEGKGIITASCKALINHCFSILNLNRIEIKCGVGNDRSAAVPKRLGFTKEGVLRQAEWLNNDFIDLTLYSVLQCEWEEAPSNRESVIVDQS